MCHPDAALQLAIQAAWLKVKRSPIPSVSALFDRDEQADVLHSCVFEMPMILLVHTHIHILSLITHSMPRYESCHMKQFKRGRTEAVSVLVQREHSAAAD